MPKFSKPSGSSEYSPEHRLNILLEEIKGQLQQFGEGQTGIQEKVDTMSERLERVEEKLDHVEADVSAIKVILKKDVTTKFEDFSKRLTAVESR